MRVSNVRGSGGEPMNIKTLRLGYAPTRFPAVAEAPAAVTSGTGRDSATGETVAWIESHAAGGHFRWTLHGDGSLQLDYSYTLDGEFSYHGITFDLAEDQLKASRWLGEGPYRVWQNRLRGTWLGVHQSTWNNPRPGVDFAYPESAGMFAGVRWARLETTAGSLTIRKGSSQTFLRVGTPSISHGNTTVGFPAGDLSILHAIPPMGSKFVGPEKSGPASQRAKAAGEYSGKLVFQFDDQPPSASKIP